MSNTILIVDDAPDWRAMLAGLIEDIYPDFRVLTAASIDEAKTRLAQHNCELAIIDIRLDESDENNTEGLELLEFSHTHYPQTQALIITSYANLKTVKQAMQPDKSGTRLAIDYIEKDKIQSELLPRISAILGESS